MTQDQSALLDLLAELNTADEGSVIGCVNLTWPRDDGLIWPHLVELRG